MAADPAHKTEPLTSAIPRQLLDRIESLWHPSQVWLFGSRARGTERPDSDWDLLVVVPDDTSEEMLDLRVGWSKISDLKLSVDLFAVRREDFEQSRKHLGSLSNIVATEGVRVDV